MQQKSYLWCQDLVKCCEQRGWLRIQSVCIWQPGNDSHQSTVFLQTRSAAVFFFNNSSASFSSSGCQVRCWPRECTARLKQIKIESASKLQISQHTPVLREIQLCDVSLDEGSVAVVTVLLPVFLHKTLHEVHSRHVFRLSQQVFGETTGETHISMNLSSCLH